MYHLESVEQMEGGRSHWVAKAPAGTRVEWDAEITEERENELIAWQATEDADVPNSGSVRFVPAPAGRGTEVHVEIEYQPPGGAVGRAVAKLFGEEPSQQVKGDLERFKQVMETGEVVRSEGSPEGLGQKLQRPAQPVETGKEQRKTRKETKEMKVRDKQAKREQKEREKQDRQREKQLRREEREQDRA